MKTFEEMNLIRPLQTTLAELEYRQPTAIQSQAAPPALEGRDVLGTAQTGTGKTAAFALPILDRFGRQNAKPTPRKPIALVLAPTRELAIQIGTSFNAYGKRISFRQALVYGGVSQKKQVQAIERGVQLLVATPGRLLDLLEQGRIDLSAVEFLVVDEVDRMLDMGFWPDLQRIIRRLPKQRQSLFFSATMPPKIAELSKRLLRNPVRVSVTPKSPVVKKIEQSVVFVERGGKQALLQEILTSDGVDQAVVFTKTKRGANRLTEKLLRNGVQAAAIHGNKSQQTREKTLTAFRRKQIAVLVATDLAARGIDVADISHVVNFDLPTEPESYVHRIGRTGRAGGEGVAVSFCTKDERGQLLGIEKLIGQSLTRSNQPAWSEQTGDSAPRPARRRAGSRKSVGSRKARTPGKRSTSNQATSNQTTSNQTPGKRSTDNRAKEGKPSGQSRKQSSRRRVRRAL